ncbi:MAG: DUF4131 domain-containing protein, partial [Pseudomonadota bacterium]
MLISRAFPVQSLRLPVAADISTRIEGWLAEERHQLPLFIPVALGAGIALWFALPTPSSWQAGICAALAVAMAGQLAGGLTRRVLTVGALLVAAGLGHAWGHAERVAAPVLSAPLFGFDVQGRVTGVEALPSRDRSRLLVTDIAGLPSALTARINVRNALPDGVRPGALVSLKASLAPPPGPSVPGGYHFARRAWFEGIGATGYALGDVDI